MPYLELGSDFGTPYFRLAAASEFVAKPTISTICCRLYDQYSLTPCCTLLVFIALLWRPRSLLIRFSTGLSWPSNQLSVDTVREKTGSCLPTISASFGKKSVSSFHLELLNSTDLTYLSLSLACRSYMYRFRMGRHGAENVIQSEIKLCDIWESFCWN